MQRDKFLVLIIVVTALISALVLTTLNRSTNLAAAQNSTGLLEAEDQDEERNSSEDEDEEDVDEDGFEYDDEDEDELEEHLLELEMELRHIELRLAEFELIERLAAIAEDDVKAAAVAVAHVTDVVDEQEAIELLNKALVRVHHPGTRRLLHMKLAELYAETDQPESAKQHLGKLIIRD
jgi:hypothetical protein